jgi:hypothetical protein
MIDEEKYLYAFGGKEVAGILLGLHMLKGVEPSLAHVTENLRVGRIKSFLCLPRT